MKRCINHLPVVLLIIGLIIVTGCTAPTEGERRQATLEVNREKLHLALEACTGTCLTREELAQLVYNYEKVQEKWSGAGFSDYEFKIPELQLVTPGEHKHDENTRYEITILGKDENGFETGLKVSVMEDTSACKFEEPEGLPVEEIVGTYVDEETVSVYMKGKDEDEDWQEIDTAEIAYKFTVTALEGNMIRIEVGGVKFGEGVYDPLTGVCEFKAAPDIYEALHTEPKDVTERFTFSKHDGQVQFELITVGQEDAKPTVVFKVE